jgi:hypothetical protein
MEMAGGTKDLEILKKLGAQFPRLNAAWLDFRGELHATNDKSIFKEKRESGYIPLYKGDMIWQYETQANQPEYWLDPNELDEYLLKRQISWLIKDLKSHISCDKNFHLYFSNGYSNTNLILKYLNLSQDIDLKKFLRPERDYYRLAFRAIASDANERTLVATLLPRGVGAQNSLWVSIPGRYALSLDGQRVEFQIISPLKLLFAQAIFNSLTVDWLLRASVAMNVNKTYVYRLPIPQPSDQELNENPIYRKLILDSALLSLYHSPIALEGIKTAFNIKDSELITTDKAYNLKKAELDINIAKLYSLTSNDLLTILENFKVLNSKKPGFVSEIKYLSEIILD